MNEMFSQGGKGSTGILTNKQAIARKFGVKQNEVVYFSVGVDLGGYKVIYDKSTQRAYSLPILPVGTTAVSLNEQAILVHSAGTVDLGELAATRREFVNLSDSFATGLVVNTRNELLVHNGIGYSYLGTLPVTITAATNPIGNADWKPQTDPNLREDLTTKGLLDPQYVATFPTVDAMRTYGNHLVGNVVRTMGYYASGDGGGATYVITAGSPLGDFSDAGSVVISGSLFAKLAQQTSFDLRQFGVKHSASDPTTLAANDTGIAAAMLRGRFGFAKILINGVIYHKKPIVVDYYQHIEGVAIGSDSSYTPRFIKVDNTTSGIAPLAYPGSSDSVIFDVDAGIIVKRQNANTDFARGITLKGFLLQSLAKSSFAIYAPHMADFNINVDSRGFNGGIRFFVNFLGRYEGRHIGLGSEASDPTLAIGVWASHFSTTLDCGNSVTFRLSLNGYNRGIQGEYFANAVLERVTMENIKNRRQAARHLLHSCLPSRRCQGNYRVKVQPRASFALELTRYTI